MIYRSPEPDIEIPEGTLHEFALILVTVVGESLTLPWPIRKLGVVDDGRSGERELKARLVIAQGGARTGRRARGGGLDP